jgi:hypothetical protein
MWRVRGRHTWLWSHTLSPQPLRGGGAPLPLYGTFPLRNHAWRYIFFISLRVFEADFQDFLTIFSNTAQLYKMKWFKTITYGLWFAESQMK